MDLDVSSNLKHDCSERHFGFDINILRHLKMAGCLGFHWAATNVETGLRAFNENFVRGPSLLARTALWIPRDLSNLMARSVFGEYWRVHVILSCVLDSGISPEFTHKWKNTISWSYKFVIYIRVYTPPPIISSVTS